MDYSFTKYCENAFKVHFDRYGGADESYMYYARQLNRNIYVLEDIWYCTRLLVFLINSNIMFFKYCLQICVRSFKISIYEVLTLF